ncbi:hypothetical protein LTR53_005911 [Teratosphaeriaceae sp. CCFEE 6253]|nr:hypothetical protein LTR53_005911 [Teratosphaeriaceae sp. CCFEE 6253]
MFAPLRRLYARGRPAEGTHSWNTLTSSKSAASILISLCFLAVLLAVLSLRALGHDSSPDSPTGLDATDAFNSPAVVPGGPGRGRFHFLIPATKSNPELCKLLVSAQILDYPPPVLINWGLAAGKGDDSNTHLAKIQGFLDYLDQLEQSSENFDEDLVLIVDGYDVWFQLRRDVLLKRYYDLNAAADARTAKAFGHELFEQHDMRQTIIFGPDKVCWPIDFGRPACWAAPLADMSEWAYGPLTNTGKEEYNHPRWLNSGTILGPAKDLRALFNATQVGIDRNWEKHKDTGYKNSDQFYFAEVFGLQEWARLEKKADLRDHYKGMKYKYDWGNPRREGPELQLEKTEYHVGIDHSSVIFQSLAFWKPYLTWTRPASSWPTGHSGSNVGTDQAAYHVRVPQDILQSAPPYSHVAAAGAADSWAGVDLLYNTVTRQIPAVIHMTAEKQFRQIWWPRLWFEADAERLRIAAINDTAAAEQAAGRVAAHGEVIGGYTWENAAPPEAEDVRLGGINGAWSDSAFWLTWRGICQEHEGILYNTTDMHYRHKSTTLPEAETDS